MMKQLNLMRNKFHKITQEFSLLLGEGDFITGAHHLAKAEKTTFISNQKIKAIAYPKTVSELHGCVLLGNKYQLPLYPVSRGKNWGYGSRVPYQTGSVLVSLEKLNRILDFDETMGYVTLEPGVSFAQLRHFLQQRNSKWLIDAPGSTLEASVIGNTIEKGFAQSQIGERHQHIASMEVLLPNGELLHTAMDAFPNANSAKLHHSGIGPDLTGLFLQSNLGVITKMTLHLAARPKYRMQLFFHFREMLLPNLTNCLRELHQKELLTVTASLYNRERLLSIVDESQHEPTDSSSTESADTWFGTSAIHGDNIQILRGKQNAIENALNTIEIEGIKPSIRFGALNQNNPHYGWSSPNNLKLAYAKLKYPNHPPNPDLDGCGLIWCAPIAPLAGAAIQKCVHIVTNIFKQYQFTPYISIHKISSRVAYVNAPIIYDRAIKGEDEKALACQQHLLKELTANGFYPYRLSQASMSAMPSPSESYSKLLQQIKQTIDPNQIIAPGRYEL